MEGFNKISLILLVACIGTVFGFDKPICRTQGHELWPHTDPNMFWYCEDAGAIAFEMPCPPETGFLRNERRTGCVPYTEWDCTVAVSTVPNCQSNDEAYNVPSFHYNPNKFYVCPEDRSRPAVAVNCPPNTGFVRNNDVMLCVPWDDWVCGASKDRE